MDRLICSFPHIYVPQSGMCDMHMSVVFDCVCVFLLPDPATLFACLELGQKACSKIHHLYRMTVQKRLEKGV